MSFKIVVLAKQVPDTRNVGKDAMKADGTVNRAALPAIFNPEDLNALELALRIKDSIPGSTITVLTMGPTRAAEVIREGLYRGADNGYLITDRKFAGSDTLATSYVLSAAVKKINPDVVVCGRQAIDGDTAQVGPQVAEKVGYPQITYAEELVDVSNTSITIKRRLERGIEVVKCPLPVVLTVHSSAPDCRSRHAKLMMKYKHSRTVTELQTETEDYIKAINNERPYLNIDEWTVADLDTNEEYLGLNGSPTKVKKIENVVLAHKETKVMSDSDAEVELLMKELIEANTFS
ncbi:MAG: electron transfer flavoprotein subunit beta/FixA family protein [Bacteroidota bacterium]